MTESTLNNDQGVREKEFTSPSSAPDSIPCTRGKGGVTSLPLDLGRRVTGLFAGNTSKAKVTRASVWIFTGYGTASLLRLGSNMILTRLLFPEAFGMMSLVIAFMQGLAMFSDVGIQPSIVQSPRGQDSEFLNTAWTIQAIRGIVLWICSVAGAYPFAIAYRQPQLTWLIPAAGCTALIAGFNSTNLATLQRQMNVKALMLCDLTCQMISLLIMVTCAATTGSVWSIVLGMLGGSVSKLIISHTYLGNFRNRLAWNPVSATALLSFGKWIFVSTVMTFLVRQTDRLLFGQIVSMAMLGVYSIAVGFAAIPQELVARIGRGIAFPIYSRTYREHGKLGEIFGRMRSPMVVAGGAVLSLLTIIAVPLVTLLYDARYVEAGWILRFLLAGIWFRVLECHCGNALLAMGHSRFIAMSGAVKLSGMFLLIALGYHLYGFPGAVASYAASESLSYIVSAWAISRQGIGVWKLDICLTMFALTTVTVGLLIQRVPLLSSSSGITNIVACVLFVGAIWLMPVLVIIHRESSLRK